MKKKRKKECFVTGKNDMKFKFLCLKFYWVTCLNLSMCYWLLLCCKGWNEWVTTAETMVRKTLRCLLSVTLWRKDNFSWTISVKPLKNFPNWYFFDASLITINISYQNSFWCSGALLETIGWTHVTACIIFVVTFKNIDLHLIFIHFLKKNMYFFKNVYVLQNWLSK